VEHEFWLERWRNNQIGFHRADANPLLIEFWPSLGITRGAGVFVPLCGKSLDMRYLESLGHPVIGVELSETAILAYFEEGGETPEHEDRFYHTRYQGSHTVIYRGDFFDIARPDILGVRAVYDRGALVALPPDVREMYADHLQRIIPEHAHVLLLTLEYDQSGVKGPPFSVSGEEVERLYGERCRIEQLGSLTTTEVPPHFNAAGISKVTESIYHLVKEH
jgi:thiopurine S-methyltransferase